MRLKRFLLLAGILLALGAVGIGWSTDLALSGRDIVTADGGGADVLAAGKGEDLLCGDMPDHYPWPSAAVPISAQVRATGDTGWVVVEGLTAAGAERTDSVWATGAGVYALSDTWWRVNVAFFRDDSTNDAAIDIINVPPSGVTVALTSIPQRHSRSCADHYTTPANVRQVIPLSWRVTPVPANADSSAVGAAAILGRAYGGNWSILDQVEWSTQAGPVAFVYPPTQWDVGGRADLVVAAGSTEARTDIGYRMQFGTK